MDQFFSLYMPREYVEAIIGCWGHISGGGGGGGGGGGDLVGTCDYLRGTFQGVVVGGM